MSSNPSMPLWDGVTVVDGHVHVYPSVALAVVLETAVRNLALSTGDRVRCAAMLLIADPPGIDFAASLRAATVSGTEAAPGWKLEATAEAYSFIVRRGERGQSTRFFLGDNGGRPRVWTVPQFELAKQLGIRILRGTDPLPIKGDERRIGSFGFGLAGDMLTRTPFASLLERLLNPHVEVFPLGTPANIVRVVSNQVRLRFAADSYA
jgi:hypothetical protein